MRVNVKKEELDATFTPKELLDKFPDLQKWGWKDMHIGILYKMGLVDGDPTRIDGKCEILMSSFLELVKRSNELRKSRVIQMEIPF